MLAARTPVVAWEWDADRDRIIASTTLRDVYGVPEIEGVSRGFTLVHPDDYEHHQTLVHRAVDRGRGYRSSFRIIRPDTGRVVWIEERAEAIADGTSQPILIGVAFVADVRQHRRVAGQVEALDALEAFGDSLLTTYAAGLRQTLWQSEGAVLGRWVKWADRAFAQRGEP